MGNRIFGTPKQPLQPKPAPPSLREQIATLEKRKDHIEKLISMYDQKAKASTRKDEAMRFLKLKVRYANEMKTIYAMLDRLEGLDNTHQRLLFQKDVLDVTKQATDVIKQNTIDPIKAESILDDAREAIEEVDEVSEALARTDPPSFELQEELDKLFEARPAVVVSLPDVPAQEETAIEKELRILVPS